jgi:MFS transporter, DHA3 family, macrolide efflux protein
LAFLGTLTNLGGFIGGFMISAWGGLKHKRIWGILIPVWLSSLFIICYGLSPSLLLTSILGFLLTFLLPISGVHSQVIWQSQTPKELQGRVFAVRRLIAQFTWPISAATVGWIGGVVSPGAVLVVLGVIALIFVSCQMFNPYLFRVEDKDYLDEIAAARAKVPPKPEKPPRLENPELLSKGDKSA